MKKFLTISFLCCTLFLSGCSSQNPSTPGSAEPVTTESTITTSELPSEESTSSISDIFSKLDSEAEELASKSSNITSGDFYDSVTNIYNSISLKDMSGSIGISIYLPHESYTADSAMFFYVISKIMESCKIEDFYSGAVFNMFVDDSFVCMMTIVNYKSSSSFTSTDPVVIVDEYKQPISDTYSIGFSTSNLSLEFENIEDLYEQQKAF